MVRCVKAEGTFDVQVGDGDAGQVAAQEAVFARSLVRAEWRRADSPEDERHWDFLYRLLLALRFTDAEGRV